MNDYYALHAKEKYALPAAWAPYRWTCQPLGHTETLYFEIRGAVAPMKRNGLGRNWRKMDKATEFTCILPIKEHADWLKAWELKNDKCNKCDGTGNAWVGWSKADGDRYNTCSKCKGTGKPTP